MSCYLGIDYGTKRIGLSLSNPEETIASPLTTLGASGRVADDVQAVLRVAREYEIEGLVVGLPLNMDGTEGKQAKITRRFGDELAKAMDEPVHFWDERLSSFAAKELLEPAELTRKKRKARLDRVAAQVILQSFLDAKARGEDLEGPAADQPAGE
jgi:putative Holliday junction resolvase